MPRNWDGSTARAFHEATSHSPESVRRGRRSLDWTNRPRPYKEYPRVGAVALARESELGRLLRWGAGVVRTTGPVDFRTYSSAGALYPVEVYVACGERPELAAGLYHFHPRDMAVRRLRREDVRGPLADAADEPALAQAGAVVVLTGILWRTAWKYEARGYRHLYWDAGTMLANLLALAAAAGLNARILTGFVDDEVNRLLGVDGDREAALALLGVGRGRPAPPSGALEPLELDVAPLSRREGEYPQARAVHEASKLASSDEVRRYRAEAASGSTAPSPVPWPRETLERILRRRGSIREFSPERVPASQLAAILAGAAALIPTDVARTSEIYGIASAIEGLESGTFRFAPPDRFEILRRGSFRHEAGYLVLEQPLGALAAATVFFMADLAAVLERLGNRGYRAAQLEAGIRTGRVYLGAFREGLGATASTFYDGEVAHFLAQGTALTPMLCAALGPR